MGGIKMSSILNFSWENFKCNKRKNILTIITIVLTTCLLTSIGILSNSVRVMNIRGMEERVGKCHGKYSNLNKKQMDTLKNNIKVKEIGQYIFAADVKNKDLGSCIMNFLYMDKTYMEMQNVKLEKGRMPEKSNEIAVERWILERLRVKPEVGEKVHFKYLLRLKDDKKEPIIDEKEFVISGILKENEYARMRYVSNAVVSRNFVENKFNSDDFKTSYYVRLKDNKNIEENILHIGKNLGVSSDDMSINKDYIKSFEIDFETIMPYIVIGLVVILSAIIVIHNIFHISIIDKIRQFGLLGALGATKKQIRKSIMLDGIFMSSIGIPLGILMGYILSYFIIPMVYVENLTIESSPYIILVTIIVSLLTVIISLIKPARMAAKVSPIEAIRFSGAKMKEKNVIKDGEKEISEKKLSYLNLWRNKKRTIMTLLSLTISGVLFMIFSTIIPSMDINQRVKEEIRSDFQMTSMHAQTDDGVSNPFKSGLIKSIKDINGVENVSLLRYTSLKLQDKTILNEKNISCDFYGFDDKMLRDSKKYLSDGKLCLDDLKNKNRVLVVVAENRPCHFKVGEKVRLKKISGNSKGKILEFMVDGIVTKNVEDLGWSHWGGAQFITHKDTFVRTLKDDRPVRLNIDIKEDKYDYVKKSLKSFGNSNVTIMDYREVKEKLENQFRGIKVVSGSIIFVIAIIGILNLINTIITSILARKKEIGMLQAVGLSDRQLIKTLQIEGMYYALISGVVSVTLGTAIGYICYRLFRKKATYAVYKFPLISLISLIVILIAVEILITYLAQRSLKKDSIVDKIRYNE